MLTVFANIKNGQIKSAIDNTGDYDASNPDINFLRAGNDKMEIGNEAGDSSDIHLSQPSKDKFIDRAKGVSQPRKIRPNTKITSDVPSVGDIRRFFAKALDIPIRDKIDPEYKGVAAGAYNNRSEVIHLDSAYFNSLRELCHENGHYIHRLLFGDNKTSFADKFEWQAQAQRELEALCKKTFGDGYQPDQYVSEGFAEFVMHLN